MRLISLKETTSCEYHGFMRHKCTENFFAARKKDEVRPRYVEMLFFHLESRLEKNKYYSVRAFARDMEMDMGHLSRIFSGIRIPRKGTAKRICDRLNFTTAETKEFLLSVKLCRDDRTDRRVKLMIEEEAKGKETTSL